jgi:hypothetical protein
MGEAACTSAATRFSPSPGPAFGNVTRANADGARAGSDSAEGQEQSDNQGGGGAQRSKCSGLPAGRTAPVGPLVPMPRYLRGADRPGVKPSRG